MKKLTPQFKKAILHAFFEYLVILAPIALYVFIEAVHKHNYMFFTTSPEWSIGTIFLSSISINEYIQRSFSTTNKKIPSLLKIYSLINAIVIVLATLNTAWSIEKESQKLIACRGILFLISTFIFFLFMTNSKLECND